jgi:hypothetical protein
MRWVRYNQARSLELYAPAVPDAAGSFVVVDCYGGAVQAATAADYTPTATTLGAVAPAGSRTLTLASTAGLVAGRDYLLGGPESEGGEFVKVKSVDSGAVVSIVRAVRRNRAVGAALASTRVLFPVAAIASPGRGYRIEWTWASGGEAQPVVDIPFDVTRYAPVTFTTFESVRALDALASKRVPEGAWTPEVLATAWTMLLRRVAAKISPGGVVGTVDLSIPHAYLTLVVMLEPGAGEDETAALIARLEKRFTQELDAALASLPTDDNQDGDSRTGESGWGTRTIRIIRG